MNNSLASFVLALVTIVGMIVLIALKDIDSATGIGVIGLLVGVHGGATIATNVNNGNSSQLSQVTSTPPGANPADSAQ